MPRAEPPVLRFVRDLVSGGEARPGPSGRWTVEGSKAASLDGGAVRALAAAGLLAMEGGSCRATREARQWLRRQLAEADGAFAAQHRLEHRRPDGTTLNLAESPLARLARATEGQPAFLASHHLEAGERVRRLVERAQLQPRLTMSYSAAHRAGGKSMSQPAAISDMAADARKALAELHRILPADCAGVVLDVCGLLKGLQTVEIERGWPRRSAKLVLRIGLDQLAHHYGLAPVAVGAESRRAHAWLGEGARPGVFG